MAAGPLTPNRESENLMIDPTPAPWMPIFVIAVLVFVGVVLPAVWSRRPERRCAATRVLRLLLAPVVDLAALLRQRAGQA